MKTRILLVTVCVGMLAGVTRAAAPLAERVPGGALAYAGWAGTTNAAFRKTTCAAFLKEPVFRRIMDSIETAIGSEMYGANKEQPIGPVVWPMAEAAVRCPTAAAWLGLDKADGGPFPRIAVLVDLGKEKKAFNGRLEALMKLIGPEARKMVKEATVGNVTYKTVQEERGPEVSFGYMGDVFFLTIGPGVAAEVIKLKSADSLQANEAFVARMKEVGRKNEQLSFYLDVPSVRKSVATVVPAADERDKDELSVDEMLRLLGMAKVRAVAGATTAVDSHFISRTKIFAEAPHKGAMMAFAGKPLTDADLAHVPADADIVLAYNISASRAWKELRKIVRGFDAEAEQEMREGFGQMGSMFGVSLEDDILGNLGDTWVVSSAVSQGGSPTGTVLTVELKDADAFARTIAKIELAAKVKNMFGGGEDGNERGNGRRSRPGIRKLKAGDAEVHYLVFSGRGFIPITPAWAVHKKKLYVAMFPQVIKSAIENDGKDPMIASPKFAAQRAKADKNALGLAYVNTPQLIGRHYAMLLIYANAASQFGAFGDDAVIASDFLPAMSTIVKYVPVTMQTVSADKTGVVFEQHGAHALSGLVDAFITVGPIMIPTVALSLSN